MPVVERVCLRVGLWTPLAPVASPLYACCLELPLSPVCRASFRLAGTPVLLAKPITFMNNSGEAVGKLMRYYKAGGRSQAYEH